MVSLHPEPMDTTTDDEEQSHGDTTLQSDDAQPAASAKPQTHTLYLRFRGRHPSIGDIKKLDAAIAKVRLPRQKSANNCLIDFRTAADMQQAADRLNALIGEGQPLVHVSVAHTSNAQTVQLKSEIVAERREQRAVLNRLLGCLEQVANTDAKRSVTNGVYVRDLPRDIRQKEVAAAFPDAIDVRVLVHERADRGAGACIELPSPADALKARKGKFVIRDVEYRPEFQRDGKLSVRLAKRLASRGVSMGPARYFLRRDGDKSGTASGDDEVKEEEEDGEVVNEILNVYN